MMKLVDFLVRTDEYSHSEFVERWQGDHSELAKDLRGLQGYKTSVPDDPEEADYDGVLELYFEDEAAMGEAFGSDIGEEVMADAAEFVDMGAGPRMVVEETVHVEVDD